MIPSEARGAWNELETRIRPYVARRMASASDVDDVVQEIFVRVHRGVADLRDGERFGGWVYRIAERAIVDSARARSRQRTVPVDELPERLDDDFDDGAELQAALGQCVAAFVARLPSPYREAVTLTELEGLTQKEAAEKLGISLSGMKSRVQRGRDKIRDMFEESCRMSVDARGKVVECVPRAMQDVQVECREMAGSAVSEGEGASCRKCS